MNFSYVPDNILQLIIGCIFENVSVHSTYHFTASIFFIPCISQ
ncbi:unnamed protein product [Acanthoscelides obtectus]|uniref:Uncharacterized protein n=1 Tax=Acanthoscelides obtectus TaxID=200917 RepID=A0A9P0JI81_ACAOB|nr:unnamed protein product [Acanthoscelides obtectus]CAK1661395.1 hypothetical protein AOBTE_LOCUS22599 [Acanthoscelides obtectus]